jgi:hypothetical protein
MDRKIVIADIQEFLWGAVMSDGQEDCRRRDSFVLCGRQHCYVSRKIGVARSQVFHVGHCCQMASKIVVAEIKVFLWGDSIQCWTVWPVARNILQ